MSEHDEPRPIDPDAPAPPAAPDPPTDATAPAYAMPVPPPGYPAYAAGGRPRFADQVMGMRAVVAVALACLVIGGLSGYILGHAAGSESGGFGRGPGFFQRDGGFRQGQGGAPVAPYGGLGQQPRG